MKYIGFKHQRENKQNSDKCLYAFNVLWWYYIWFDEKNQMKSH